MRPIRPAHLVLLALPCLGCGVVLGLEDHSLGGGGAGAASGTAGSGQGGSAAGGTGAEGGSPRSLGLALELDGSCASRDDVDALDFDAADFTVELWFRPEVVGPGFTNLVWKGGTSDGYPGWAIDTDGTAIRLTTHDGTSNGQAGEMGVLAPGGTYHVVAVKAGSTGEMWVLDRGQRQTVHVKLGEATMPVGWANTQRVSIGAQADVANVCNDHTVGVIDEVRIWEGARIDEDFNADYDRKIPCDTGDGSGAKLVAHFGMEEDGGNALVDCAGADLTLGPGSTGMGYDWIDSPFDDP